MADGKERVDAAEISSDSDLCREELYCRMQEISKIVQRARLKAREADIRSKYAIEFANRAAAEALAAHQVSESLAQTSRMVAALALEFSNDISMYSDSLVDSILSDTHYSIVNDTETSLLSAGEISVQSGDGQWEVDSQMKNDVSFSEKGDIVNNDTVKDQVKLPEVQQFNENATERKLSEENEVSINKVEYTPHPDNSCPACVVSNSDLSEEIKTLEIKRKMLLYRDSKMLAFQRRNPEYASLPSEYADRGSQTSPC